MSPECDKKLPNRNKRERGLAGRCKG